VQGKEVIYTYGFKLNPNIHKHQIFVEFFRDGGFGWLEQCDRLLFWDICLPLTGLIYMA